MHGRQVPTWPHGSRATAAGESQQTRQREGGEAAAAAAVEVAAAEGKGAEGCPPPPAPAPLEAVPLLPGDKAEVAGGSLTSSEALRKTLSPATECLLARASASIAGVEPGAGFEEGGGEEAAVFLLGEGERRAGSRRELP